MMKFLKRNYLPYIIIIYLNRSINRTPKQDIFSTSIVNENEAENEKQDIWSTSVQHNEEPAETPAQSSSGDDIWSTSVVNDEPEPKLASPLRTRKDSARGRAPSLNSSANISPTDMKQIMEFTAKSIKESQEAMLRAMKESEDRMRNAVEDVKKEILGKEILRKFLY